MKDQRLLIETGKKTSFLDRDVAEEKKVGNTFHPSVSINKHTFRGEYEDPNDIFKSICQTMLERPAVCLTNSITNYLPGSPLH